jgi:hypothetical protein
MMNTTKPHLSSFFANAYFKYPLASEASDKKAQQRALRHHHAGLIGPRLKSRLPLIRARQYLLTVSLSTFAMGGF